VLFGFLGYWMLKSDARLDQLRVGKLTLCGNAGKIAAIWDKAASPTVGIRNAYLPSWMGYASVPLGDPDDADAPEFKWTSFTYSSQGTLTSIVIPAWLPLLIFAIMPGVWIYGMPAKRKPQQAQDTDSSSATTRGFAG
jgi:hypothetical protein